jgi:porphyrinogen peroxidase
MSTAQAGIFALGTASHAYLEFDLRDRGARQELVTAVASLREPRTTMGGVNLVVGFRPELWAAVAPDDAPPELEGFNHDVVGPDGCTGPSPTTGRCSSASAQRNSRWRRCSRAWLD